MRTLYHAISILALTAALTAVAPAARFSYPDLPAADKSGVHLSDMQGKPLLVVFWAVWCEPCAEEMPQIENLHARFRAEGLQVTGVAVSSPLSAAQKFLARAHVSFPNFLDPSSEFSESLAIAGVPALLLVRPNGSIAYSQSGYVNLPLDDLQAQIQVLLPQKIIIRKKS